MLSWVFSKSWDSFRFYCTLGARKVYEFEQNNSPSIGGLKYKPMLNVITILLACVQYQSSTCDFLKVLFVQLDGDGLNPNVVQRKCWNSQDSNSIPLSWIESDENRMNQSKIFGAERYQPFGNKMNF